MRAATSGHRAAGGRGGYEQLGGPFPSEAVEPPGDRADSDNFDNERDRGTALSANLVFSTPIMSFRCLAIPRLSQLAPHCARPLGGSDHVAAAAGGAGRQLPNAITFEKQPMFQRKFMELFSLSSWP